MADKNGTAATPPKEKPSRPSRARAGTSAAADAAVPTTVASSDGGAISAPLPPADTVKDPPLDAFAQYTRHGLDGLKELGLEMSIKFLGWVVKRAEDAAEATHHICMQVCGTLLPMPKEIIRHARDKFNEILGEEEETRPAATAATPRQTPPPTPPAATAPAAPARETAAPVASRPPAAPAKTESPQLAKVAPPARATTPAPAKAAPTVTRTPAAAPTPPARGKVVVAEHKEPERKRGAIAVSSDSHHREERPKKKCMFRKNGNGEEVCSREAKPGSDACTEHCEACPTCGLNLLPVWHAGRNMYDSKKNQPVRFKGNSVPRTCRRCSGQILQSYTNKDWDGSVDLPTEEEVRRDEAYDKQFWAANPEPSDESEQDAKVEADAAEASYEGLEDEESEAAATTEQDPANVQCEFKAGTPGLEGSDVQGVFCFDSTGRCENRGATPGKRNNLYCKRHQDGPTRDADELAAKRARRSR